MENNYKNKKFFQIIIITFLLMTLVFRMQFDSELYNRYFVQRNSEDMTFYGSVDIETNDRTMNIVGGVIPTLFICCLMVETI